MKKVYVVTMVAGSSTEMVTLNTEVFMDRQQAFDYAKNEEKQFISELEDLGFSEEEIMETLILDNEYNDGLYRHYVYNEGDEKVFSIECKEID